MNDPYFTANDPADRPKAGGRPKRRWAIEVLVSIAVLIPIWAFLFYPIVTSENFGKPHGEPVPTDLPDEARRVRHPQGFSLVYPPNWEVSVYGPPEAMIQGYPRFLFPSRISASITVLNLGWDRPPGPDLASFRPTRFQGRPAHEWSRISRRIRGGTQHIYELCFQRDGCWYRLLYTGTRDVQGLPAMILPYLSTFRVERPPAS